MESTAQEQLLSSLRHTLLDLARRLQQDTVSEDVADYVLFRLENEKKKRTSICSISLPRFSRNSTNSKQTPQQEQYPFEEGAENLSPGQGHSLNSQLKSHSLAWVFSVAPFRGRRNSGEAGSRLPGKETC